MKIQFHENYLIELIINIMEIGNELVNKIDNNDITFKYLDQLLVTLSLIFKKNPVLITSLNNEILRNNLNPTKESLAVNALISFKENYLKGRS